MVKIAFDVNGTLTQARVRWLFASINRNKAEVIVWSTLGRLYCQRFCREHGLDADEYLDKHEVVVDIALDDFPESIGNVGEVIGV